MAVMSLPSYSQERSSTTSLSSTSVKQEASTSAVAPAAGWVVTTAGMTGGITPPSPAWGMFTSSSWYIFGGITSSRFTVLLKRQKHLKYYALYRSTKAENTNTTPSKNSRNSTVVWILKGPELQYVSSYTDLMVVRHKSRVKQRNLLSRSANIFDKGCIPKKPDRQNEERRKRRANMLDIV